MACFVLRVRYRLGDNSLYDCGHMGLIPHFGIGRFIQMYDKYMMEHQFILSGVSTKEERYREFLPQFESLVSDVDDEIAALANAAAALREVFGFFWVGFYRVKGDCLVLGPFQGSVACYRIKRGKGVCGTAWEQGQAIVVPDVDKFPGHIACSSLSRSEIVVPVFSTGKEPVVKCVLDIDSEQYATFDDIDKYYLEKIAANSFSIALLI